MAFFAGLRLLLALEVPLLPTEAYYWLWSRELAWSYYDHPPLVAAVIRLFSPWLDHSVLGLRLGHLVLSTLGSLVFYALCLRLVAPRAALACLVVLGFAPFWLPFGVAATPDGPLLFFWTLALLLFHRAWQRDTLGSWAAAGVATGLAILSKYTALLLGPTLLTFLWIDPRGRGQLRSPGPYLAAGLALAVLVPNLLWNIGHGAETLQTPFRDGLELLRAPRHLAELAVLPWVLMTPLVAAAWLWQTGTGIRGGRLQRDPAFRFAVCTSWVPLAAFVVVALLTQVHAHWIAPCLVMALPIALEGLGRPIPGARPRFLRFSIVAGGLFVLLAMGGTVAALVLARPEAGAGRPRGIASLALDARGLPLLSERVKRELADPPGDRPFFLSSGHCHITSYIAWATRGRYAAFPLDPRFRYQYEYWWDEAELVGRDAFVVEKLPMRPDRELLLHEICESLEPLEPVTVPVGDESFERFALIWCRGYRGSPCPGGEHPLSCHPVFLEQRARARGARSVEGEPR